MAMRSIPVGAPVHLGAFRAKWNIHDVNTTIWIFQDDNLERTERPGEMQRPLPSYAQCGLFLAGK